MKIDIIKRFANKAVIIFVFSFVVCIAVFFIPFESSLAASTLKQTFPRIGQYKIGSPQPYGDPSAQAQLAKFDLAIIDFSAKWGSGQEMSAAARAIKGRNPRIILLDYSVINETSRTGPGVKYLRDKLNAEKWWLYPSGASGTPVASVWPGAGMTNYSDFAPKDASGDRYNTWYAKQQNALVWSKVPELDGVFEDNFFWRARVTGDWDRDGSSDSQTKSIPWHRVGMITHINTIKGLMPGKLVTGNIGDWRNTPTVPEYEGQLDGGILESYLCGFERSFSETFGEYHRRMRETKGPKLVMLGADRCTEKGFDHYKSFRYGLGIVLMNDGYYAFSENYTQFPVDWFDEYDLAGKSTTDWLGIAVQGPQTSVWQNGVYKREFQNGMALVNGSGSSQTVNVGSGWKRIQGTQQPSINNGQSVTGSITIPARDGILLVRDGAPVPPPGSRLPTTGTAFPTTGTSLPTTGTAFPTPTSPYSTPTLYCLGGIPCTGMTPTTQVMPIPSGANKLVVRSEEIPSQVRGRSGGGENVGLIQIILEFLRKIIELIQQLF